MIRINRLLCAPNGRPSRTSCSTFLVWHELLHHVLLRQGHDAQFRTSSTHGRTPSSSTVELATFHEHWNTDPAAY